MWHRGIEIQVSQPFGSNTVQVWTYRAIDCLFHLNTRYSLCFPLTEPYREHNKEERLDYKLKNVVVVE